MQRLPSLGAPRMLALTGKKRLLDTATGTGQSDGYLRQCGHR